MQLEKIIMKGLTHLSLLLVLFATLLTQPAYSQKREIQKAKRLMKIGEFHKAIPYLHLALNKNATDAYPAYLLGICYREVEDYKNSQLFFEHSNAMSPGTFHDTYLRIAEVYHMDNNFEKAIPYYELHKQNVTGDSIALMDLFIKQCRNGIDAMKDSAIVEITNIGPFINTRYSEYACIFDPEFTKMRFTSRRPRKGVKQYTFAAYFHDIYEDIYEAELETNTGIWHKTELHSIRSKRNHEATIYVSPEGNEMYVYVSKNGGDICVSKKVGKKWTKPTPIKGINTKYWETSFCFSEDFQTIYFASNRPGGKGGLDLYVSHREGDGWSNPEPLSINTPYDEDAPYISGEFLYFSSRSELSNGGYDIFRIKLGDLDAGIPEKLPYPLNTGAEDIFYNVNEVEQIGYFSSNRAGGFGGMDIYKINWNPPYKDSLLALRELERQKDSIYAAYKSGNLVTPGEKNNVEEETIGAPLVLRGFVYELITGKPLKAEVYLLDAKTQEVLQKVTTDNKTGKFIIPAISGKKYKIQVEAPGYLRHFEDFYVFPGEEINVQPKHIPLQKNQMGNKILLSWHFFDYDKYTLRTESIPELENLIHLMKIIPTIKIKVVGHTDSDGSESYNQKLSENRASTVKQYIIDKGIEPSRIIIEGKGESVPLYDNNNPKLKQWNRRVEITIIE